MAYTVVFIFLNNAAAGVILVTDGVCGFVGSGVMNTLVGQMRRSNISCWALLVGGSPSPMCW